MKKELEPIGYKIPTKAVSKIKLKIASFIVPPLRALVPRLDKEFSIDNSSSTSIGITYNEDIRKSIIEMSYSIIDFKLVSDHRDKEN